MTLDIFFTDLGAFFGFDCAVFDFIILIINQARQFHGAKIKQWLRAIKSHLQLLKSRIGLK